MSRAYDTPYIPAAVSTVAMSGRFTCPDCGKEATYGHGLMGTDEPIRCGRCYDLWAFRSRDRLRHYVSVLWSRRYAPIERACLRRALATRRAA